MPETSHHHNPRYNKNVVFLFDIFFIVKPPSRVLNTFKKLNFKSIQDENILFILFRYLGGLVLGTFYTFYWLGLSFGGHFPTFLKTSGNDEKIFHYFSAYASRKSEEGKFLTGFLDFDSETVTVSDIKWPCEMAVSEGL